MKTRRSEAIWIESRQRWQINVQRDGQRKTFTDSTPGRQGKHNAEAKADKWLTKFSTEQKLCDAWDAFLEDKSRDVARITYTNYTIQYQRITKTIPESKKLSMISLYDWQKVLDNLANEGLSASTIKGTLAAITSLNSYALRRRWECEEIRAGDLVVPKNAGKPKEKNALSETALKALFSLDDTDNYYIYFYQFLPLTGLRMGEARALKWSDISDHVLHLSRAINMIGDITEGKTKNASRNIPLIPQAESILDEQRALLKRWNMESEYVFPSKDGGIIPYAQTEYNWLLVAKLIGTSCTIHELRHTFISMSKSKLPLALLKNVVGHSSAMDTLGVYGHETESDIQESREIINAVFEGY